MTQSLVAYVAIVGAIGGALLALSFHAFWSIGAMYLAAWIVVSLLAESLWLPTVTGKAMESMASTVDISLLILLGYKPAIWIVAIGFTLANVFSHPSSSSPISRSGSTGWSSSSCRSS